jgi:hypothetical protein
VCTAWFMKGSKLTQNCSDLISPDKAIPEFIWDY